VVPSGTGARILTASFRGKQCIPRVAANVGLRCECAVEEIAAPFEKEMLITDALVHVWEPNRPRLPDLTARWTSLGTPEFL